MIVLAGAFGSFMLFVLAGLLALVMTALLDRNSSPTYSVPAFTWPKLTTTRAAS